MKKARVGERISPREEETQPQGVVNQLRRRQPTMDARHVVWKVTNREDAGIYSLLLRT
jgi:hypothetical protein